MSFNPLSDFPIAIDSTMRSAFVACETKFYRQYIQGMQSLGGSVHLVAGGAFAKGLEVVRRKFYGEGMDLDDAICEGAIAALIHYGDFDPPARSFKTPERVVFAIAEYFAEHDPRIDPIQPMKGHNNEPAVEFSFSLPLEVSHPTSGDPLLYAGRFDMVGLFQSAAWVVDEKTASRLGPSWVKSFILRGQLIGYCYAAREFGIPVNGFIVRGISFLTDYYGHATAMDAVPSYRLDQWWEQINVDAQKMVDAWKANKYSLNFADSCIGPYSPCPFAVLCEKQNPDSWASQYFEIARWNPLDVNPSKAMTVSDKPILTFAS